jgi:iron complex outermembrane recepter protein
MSNKNSRMSVRRYLMAATMLSSLGVAATAQAQDAGPQQLEEIVVTSRKQTEKLQDIPVTVTAFSEAAIEKLQVKSLFDLATVTPGLYYGTTGGRNGGNKLQIRNFSTGTGGGSKASAFVDGVYISGDYSSTPLANLARIEVLKGPQSVAYGRSTFVGAVNFVTKDPSIDTFTGNLEANVVTEGEYDLNGYISVPLIKDVLATQLTFRSYKFEGPDEWTNADGYHLGEQSTNAISLKTIFAPTDNLTFRLYYSFVKDDDEIPPVFYNPLNERNSVIPRPGGTFGYYYAGEQDTDFNFRNRRLDVVGFMTDPGFQREQHRVSLFYEWNVLNHTVSGFASTLREDMRQEQDGLFQGRGTVVAPNAFNVPVVYTYQNSNSVNLIDTEDTQFEFRVTSPQDQRFRYTFGGNYTDISGSVEITSTAILANGQRAPNFGQKTFASNQWSGNFNIPARNKSVFAGVYFDITEKLTVSAEVRYQEERINLQNYLANTNFTADFTATLPRFNVQYKITEDIQLYGVYSEGTNPGGFNGVPAAFLPPGTSQAFPEEKMINYEAGLKSLWLDGRLLVNLAIFRMNWENQQVLQSYVTNRTFIGQVEGVTQANAASHVNGIEAEVEAILTDELRVRATAGYGKAVYDDFCSSSYAALIGRQDRLGCALVNGKQQEGTPAFQTSLSGDYSRPLNDTWNFYARGDWQYQSKVYLEEWDASWIPPIHMVNARFGIENGSYTIEVFGRNLLDDDTGPRTTRVTDGRNNNAGISGYPSINGVAQGAAGAQNFASTSKKPRQFGIRLGYSF